MRAVKDVLLVSSLPAVSASEFEEGIVVNIVLPKVELYAPLALLAFAVLLILLAEIAGKLCGQRRSLCRV